MRIKFFTESVQICLLIVLLSAPGFKSHAEGGGGYDAPYFQADFTQDLNSWTSALVNPALLYRVNQMHLHLGMYRWAMDRGNLGYQDLGFLYPIRRNHTVGLTVLHARNAIEKTHIQNGEIVFGGEASFQDMWFIGNYGVRVLPWLMLGGNVKLRTQLQFGAYSVSKIPGLDAGVYFNPLDHYRYGDLGISLAVQDLLPTQIEWKDSTGNVDVSEAGNLITASRARLGVRYSCLNDNLVASFEVLIDNALRDFYANLGWSDWKEMFKTAQEDGNLEGAFPIIPRYGFHVKYMFIPQIWLKGGWTNNNIPYVGFNYNMIYPLPEMINYLNLDYHIGYSFIERANSLRDERGLTMMFRLSSDIGKTREQKESKRLYDKLVVAPMDAYQKAMKLYHDGKYWEASFAFGKVMTLFPNFFLNDKAIYYMADSYKKLYMNQTARDVYKEALEEYTTSDMRAKYLYGLMSLDYREEKYDEALKNHAFITNLYSESDIRSDADYLAGEIHFMRKNYNVAEQLFNRIKPGDPTYLYARYTQAIINVENDKNQAAVQNLKTIIEDTTSLSHDQLLQDAANIKLGHLYFETGDKLREAVKCYGRVSPGTEYGDEALLGIAWSWVKANQPSVAIKKVNRLIAGYPQSPFVPEAYLIKGYSLMLLKKYREAIPVLEQCIAAAKGDFITDEDVQERRGEFDKATGEFWPVAEKIKRNALRKPTPRTVRERDGYYNEYQKFAEEGEQYFRFKVLAKEHSRFFRREEDILADAEYALAKATNYVNTHKASEFLQEEEKEEGKIDDEIGELERELDNLEE
ncbi:MAG: tetratricopeptide repeat protein [Chitinispirillaceae bacterium]